MDVGLPALRSLSRMKPDTYPGEGSDVQASEHRDGSFAAAGGKHRPGSLRTTGDGGDSLKHVGIRDGGGRQAQPRASVGDPHTYCYADEAPDRLPSTVAHLMIGRGANG